VRTAVLPDHQLVVTLQVHAAILCSLLGTILDPVRGSLAHGTPSDTESPSRRLVSPNHTTVDGEQLPIDVITIHLLGLQVAQDVVPQTASGPVTETVINRLPRAEALRDVAPAAAIGQRDSPILGASGG
jgi:hypothetical protein